jgi:Cellulase (glycosyl hydrolase family 5)
LGRYPILGRRWVLAGLLAALLVTLLIPEQGLAKRHRAGAAVGQLRGVNLSPFRAFMPGAQSDADNQREVESACRLGANLIRVFVSWDQLEPGRRVVSPEYAAELDSLMRQAASCGARVMMMLVTTPHWASSAPAGTGQYLSGRYPPRDPDEFGWMVSWILSRFPSLQSLEVWNEPNYTPYWAGSPTDYVRLVNEAAAAKREVGSSTLILAGALSSGVLGYLVNYLNQLYAAGLGAEDGISVHPYSMHCDAKCSFFDPGLPHAPFRETITRIHSVMAAHGDQSGLWLTEFGFASCPAQPLCVRESQQADWTADSIQVAACYPYVMGMTPFTIRDLIGDPRYASISDAHFGLLRPDFSPKPAFSALASSYWGFRAAERRYAKARRGRRSRLAKKSLAGSPKCQRMLEARHARKSRR